jgi:hypothetical protein
MKVSRNDPCPCGSGKKYKHCCLPKERTLPVQPSNKPEIIDWHLEGNGKTWRRVPGALAVQIVGMRPEDSDKVIEGLFSGAISLASEHGIDSLTEKLRDCKHKLYAVRYHLKAIEREIDERVADFKKQYAAMSGASLELANPVLIYETEAFLFQVKGNLDLMIQALSSVIPPLKSFTTFKHAGERGTHKYIAGGKVIKQLKRSDELELCQLFDLHRSAWIQEMTLLRDMVTHHSGLRDFRCFIEEPYRGGDKINIHYPRMPSGERVDAYCQKAYDRLCELYRSVLRSIEQRIR